MLLGMVHGQCHQEWSMVCVIRDNPWSVLSGMVHGLCHQEWSMMCVTRNGPWSVFQLETLKAQYEEQVASLREELEHERSTSGRQPPLEASGGIPHTASAEDKKDETDSHVDDKSLFLKVGLSYNCF